MPSITGRIGFRLPLRSSTTSEAKKGFDAESDAGKRELTNYKHFELWCPPTDILSIQSDVLFGVLSHKLLPFKCAPRYTERIRTYTLMARTVVIKHYRS